MCKKNKKVYSQCIIIIVSNLSSHNYTSSANCHQQYQQLCTRGGIFFFIYNKKKKREHFYNMRNIIYIKTSSRSAVKPDENCWPCYLLLSRTRHRSATHNRRASTKPKAAIRIELSHSNFLSSPLYTTSLHSLCLSLSLFSLLLALIYTQSTPPPLLSETTGTMYKYTTSIHSTPV